MKKLPQIFLVVLFSVFVVTSYAQSWNAMFTIDPYPSPYISDWQSNPTIAALEVYNNTQKPEVVIINIEVFDDGGDLCVLGRSQRLLVNPGEPLLINTAGYTDWQTESMDENLRQQTNRTGMFPEGTYEVIVTIKNLWGTVLVQDVSAFFTIAHPEPPELIYPIDSEEIYSEYPIFQWIPPNIPAGISIVYTLRIVELMTGQTPDMALASNYPHFENFNIIDTNFEYPIDAFPLEANKTYAWQVQALDYQGRAATKNEGRSIIGLFTTPASFEGVLPNLELIAPENNTLLTTSNPAFEWIEPLVNIEGLIYYTITVAEVMTGQSPEQAILSNTPYFINAATITQTEFQYPAFAPELETGKNYAWQVRALDQYGQPVTANEGKSEVRSFTAGGEAPVFVETILLPEKLPLPTEEIAYLLLKNGENPLVNYSFSPDSSEITVSSTSPGTTPLLFPCLQGDMFNPPQLGATVNVTFDRYTLEILNGDITASPQLDTESPFNLARLGIPAAVQNIQYQPGSGDFTFSAVLSLFNTLFRSSPVRLILSSSGIISGTVPDQLVSGNIPLVGATQRLVYAPQSIQGEIWSSVLSDVNQTNLDIKGALVFLPYRSNPQERSISLDLNIAKDYTSITSYGSIPEPEGITIPVGPMNMNLHNFICNTFTWSSDYKTWNFDFIFDVNLSLTDFQPHLHSPLMSSVHLTGEGFSFPQVSISNLDFDNFFVFQKIQIKPYAFRMDTHTFDWFSWSGKETGDWGFRFDFKVKFFDLPDRLSEFSNEINRNPLTVLNASYVNGNFLGSIEPRNYPIPISAPFNHGSCSGLLIKNITGEFREEQGIPVIDFSILADVILPSTAGEGNQTVDLGDTRLDMSTQGIFKGQSPSFTLPYPLPWEQLQINTISSALVLDQDNNQQTAVLDLEGTITIPVTQNSSVNAAGSGEFDLMNEQITSGEFTISDPFIIEVPAFTSAPALQLHCEQGAVMNPSGLQLKDGSGELFLPGTPVPLTYSDNVTFSLPDLNLISGTISFDNSFAFQISNLNGNTDAMQWKAVRTGASPLTTLNNLILPLPGSVTIKNGTLTAQGNSQSSVYFNNEEFTNLEARFSKDFSVVFHSVKVGSGRVDFYSNNDQVAYLDSTGFWPGEFFIVDSLFTILPLPDSTIAYIKLKDQQGNSLVSVEEANENIRLFTQNGQKADLYLPALSFNSNSVPVVQTSLDVVVNPSTFRMVSGSLSLTAPSGGELVSLTASGIPLKVTALEYNNADGEFNMYANLKLILPKALQGADLTARNIPLTANGFETFDTGYSSSYKSGATAKVDIGEYLQVTLDGMRVNVASDPDSVLFSGNILMDLFTSQNSTDPYKIHYYADVDTDSVRFYFDRSHWSNGALPLGCGEFQVITSNGSPGISVSAPINKNTFNFKILQGILSLSNLCEGFDISIENLSINQDGISIPDVSFPQGNEQILSLFGADITVKSISFNITSSGVLEMLLNGSMMLFGKNIDFSGLSVTTDCTIGNTKLAMNPVELVEGSLSIDSLRIQNNILQVHGNFIPMEPFNEMVSLYTININSEGSWMDESGNVLSEKMIAVISQENPQDQGISLGMEPLDVICKLAKVDIGFNGDSNKDAIGNIDIEINSYWPSQEETETKIPIIGSLSFPATDGSQDSWIIDKNTVSVISLADLLTLELQNINVLDETEFTISLGGNFSLNLPNLGEDQGGGGEFTDFLLKEGTFEFGTVKNADFDISGVNVQLSRFAFGFDLSNFATYDVTFDKNNAAATPTSISHKGFYLIFGGSISSELFGFDGGIDSLLIYKSTDQFYLLIKNAHFEYSDMIDGALDLILDIDLDEVDFQFLVGGHLTVTEKGFAVVGEISYKETTYGGQTFMCPGFGLFLAASTGLDIRLTPLPITIEGLGLGVFFNPDPKVEEWVRSHLGFENSTEDQEFFDAYNEYMDEVSDIMTFLEIYAYINVSVPEKAVLEAQALLTLATDKLRLDMKVNVIGNKEFQKYCKLEGSGFIEIGVPQDFSDWPYAAGNITVGMTTKDQSGVDLINLPSPGQATSQIEFFVIDEENWALHGAIWAEVARAFEADFEFFIGPPGFLVKAGISRSFDAVVVKVEVGMELSVWYVWEEPREWGGYGRAWVQAICLSEDFAGVRGELGAALIGTPEFYIYGYAELTAYFLDWEWSKCVWVEWRDGSIDGGTGGDSRMQEIIAQASAVSDRIMGQVDEIEDEILQTKRNAFTQLSPQDIKNIINTIRSGQADFYWSDLKEDANAVINSLDYYMSYINDKSYVQSCKTIFVNYKNEVIQAFHPDTLGVLNGALDDYSEAVENLNTALSGKVDEYQDMYKSLKTQIQQSSFALDTLIAFSDIPDSPIENPLSMSGMEIGGNVVPKFSVDTTRANSNQKNSAGLQQSFDTWLTEVVEKLGAMETLRAQLYTGFGPGSEISNTQGEFIASLLEKNILGKSLLKKVSRFHDFYLARKDRCDNLYYQNINEFKNVFRFSRWDPAIGDNNQEFIDEANERRYGALKSLAGGKISIDPESIESWLASEELGIAFYTTVPFLFYDFTLNKMDSLYNTMVPAYNQAFWARNEIHRDFTLQTDVIWNKYAELSENLYNLYDTLIDEVKAYEKTYGTSTPVSSEELKNRMKTLSDEFLLSSLSSFSASRTDAQKRYTPITVGFNWTENQDISEYAFSIAEEGTNLFQSVGDFHQFGLDFFLPVSWPPIRRQYEVRTRVRNKAGYEVAGQVVDISLEKSVNRSSSTINETTPYSSYDYVISSIDFPHNYAKRGVNYFKNSESQIHVDWQVNTSKGPSPFAEHRYRVYKKDSPGNPIVDWTTTGTLTEVTIRDLNLNANTSSPYIVQIAGYDAEGQVRCTEESPPLYIDHTPPHFPDDIQMELIRPYGENRVIFECRQARDWFANEKSNPNLNVRIDTLAAYQYKLYYTNENPDSISWKTIDSFALPIYGHESYKQSDFIHIDLGIHPIRADMKLALRARNLHAANNNGFGEVKVVNIPQQEDKTPPQAPSFNIAGKDENGNIVLNIVSIAEDQESGIVGYNYKLVSVLQNQKVIRAFPENALQVDFSADSVYPGKQLIIPINHESLDVRGMWVGVYLTGVNNSGDFGGTDVDFICFAPDKPVLKASLQHLSFPGSEPYTRLQFGINTDPHPADFTVNMRFGTTPNGSEIGRVGYLFGPSYTNTLTNSMRLPDSLTYGSPVYVTARSVTRMFDNQREKSDSVLVSLMTPDPPMFTKVTQNQEGYLVIPINSPAFNGRKLASYQFEIQNNFKENQNIIRPFPLDPLQADFSIDQVQTGEQLKLPLLAKDMAPTIQVKLRARSADGDVAMKEVRYEPIPPLPKITGQITRHQLVQSYLLQLQGYFDDPILQANSGIHFMIGSEEGKNDIYENNLYPSVSYGKKGFNIFGLPDQVSEYTKLYLSAMNVTGSAEESAYYDTVLSVPPPLMFDQVKKNDAGYLMVHMLSSGFAPENSIAGYQFGVFLNDANKTPIRSFPASISDYDFISQEVVMDEYLELPVHISELPLKKLVLVSIKAISTSGESVTHQKGYMPYPPIPVNAVLTRDSNGTILKFKGVFEDIYRFGGQLTMYFTLGTSPDNDDVLTGQFDLGVNGDYNTAFGLNDNLEVGEFYYLSSWYVKENEKSGIFKQQLTLPCVPMFTEIKQPDEQSLALPIESTGFNNSFNLVGYQYALGSASGNYNVRPFPGSSENVDFTPDQVQLNQDLIIQQPTLGLPEECFVALKAINANGVTDICEQSFRPRPATPVIRLLGLHQPPDGNTNILRFEVDNNSIDSKTALLIMSAYHGSDTPIIVTEDGRYSYPTWEWSIYYNENQSDPVLECHFTKLMLTAWDYFIEVKSVDKYRDKESGIYKLKFNIDGDLNITNIEVMDSE